jgi:hypothetical protein
MKNPYALILLVAATTAYGQINNPPTSVNIVDSTATGRAVLTATNCCGGCYGHWPWHSQPQPTTWSSAGSK